MTAWFAYGVPLAALCAGLVGYLFILRQSRAFDRRHAVSIGRSAERPATPHPASKP